MANYPKSFVICYRQALCRTWCFYQSCTTGLNVAAQLPQIIRKERVFISKWNLVEKKSYHLVTTFVFQKESLQPKVLRRRCDSVSYGLQNRTVYKSGQNGVIFNTVNPITNTNFNPKSNTTPKPNPTNTRRLLYSHSSYSSFRRAVPISHTASSDLMPTFNTAESPAASGICFHWNLCC